MTLKKIKIIGAIAGEMFSYAPGEIVEVEEDIARVWHEAGLSTHAPEGDAARIEELEKQLLAAVIERDGFAAVNAKLEAALAALNAKLERELATLERKHAALERELAAAIAEMAVHNPSAESAT